MENYDSSGPNGEEDEGQQSEEEPGGTAAHLVAGLGYAEGSKEGSRKGLKKSHSLMVRGCIPGVRFSALQLEMMGLRVKNPGRERNI
jgi:hypothetical protein